MLVTKYQKPFELFNDFFDSYADRGFNVGLMDFNPSVNTREGESAYHVEVDLPGIEKENVDVKVEDNILTISGKREFKNEIKKEDYYKMESSYGSFSRSFTLPQEVDAENIRAASNDGVLEVIVPKLKGVESKAKKIEIK